MEPHDEEGRKIHAAAMRNAESIQRARQAADRDLVAAKDELEQTASKLRDETRVLEVLQRTGMVLASNLDLQSLLQAVTDAATEVTGAEFGAFFFNVTGEAGEEYQLYTLAGAPRSAFEGLGHPRPTALFGPTFRGEPTIRLHDVLEDERYGRWAPHYGMPRGHLPVRSYLATPVIGRAGDVIGGLFFGHSKPGMFSERSERLVTGVAAQAAIALDNARLYDMAQRAAEERRVLLERERAARGDAERESAMKDEFLATLSHELRTPLGAILGWAQVLKFRSVGEEEMRQGLDTIERNARVQAQLIDDLLDMSRVNSGNLRLDVQLVPPVAVVEAAIETVRPAADAKGIRLRAMLDGATPPVSGDPGRLQQVVWNLLSNAIKFTPRAGSVQVQLRRVDSSVEIRVSDTGIGIATDFLPHVFDRFRQASAATTRSHGGLGLGLAIVKRLVEVHGGTVEAESAGEGRGSTFTVLLPVAALAQRAAAAASAPDRVPAVGATIEGADLGGVRVLVVDDEPDARALVRRVLEECRAIVFTAASAAEGLRIAARSEERRWRRKS
jgi:signal transduction histidine kinase